MQGLLATAEVCEVGGRKAGTPGQEQRKGGEAVWAAASLPNWSPAVCYSPSGGPGSPETTSPRLPGMLPCCWLSGEG